MEFLKPALVTDHTQHKTRTTREFPVSMGNRKFASVATAQFRRLFQELATRRTLNSHSTTNCPSIRRVHVTSFCNSQTCHFVLGTRMIQLTQNPLSSWRATQRAQVDPPSTKILFAPVFATQQRAIGFPNIGLKMVPKANDSSV